jgi:type IV secretory pathway VirB4 component
LKHAFAVTGYPAEVALGWLEPLTAYPGRLDIALHIEPVPPAVAADRLRRQRARLESSRRTWAGQGRLDDPQTEAAAEDARALAYQVARGEGKLSRLGLHLTVHGADPKDLAGQVAGVRALADSLPLSTAPATYRSLQGWVTTLPAGTDALKLCRTMDTASLAAAFPFTSPDLPRDPAAPDALPGVLYGASASGPGLVAWDRWQQDNHNSVTLTTSGAGKSCLGKLEISRQLYAGTECWVVDPEDEYARLRAALGGAYIHLGAPGVHLNPFDLPDPSGHGRTR